MPRSPLVSQATKELALYFQAITDASFIDRTWELKTAIGANAAQILVGGATQIRASNDIVRAGAENLPGSDTASLLSDLINGAVGIGSFFESVNLESPYKDEFRFYAVDESQADKFTMKELERDDVEGAGPNPHTLPSTTAPNFYSVNVYNPFMGPTTRDTGAVEIFMNAIPTLEFSRCVPYINFELITLRKEAGAASPSPGLSMIGFLNPEKRSSVDDAMLSGQAATVQSEVLNLGAGIRSGIELFTMPQTLVNLGPTSTEFVPVIDRFRPLATLDNLSLSTKMQGGTLSFTTGRIEITIYDRSRLREVAPFIRPDLYGTTFIDITHGWSHPDGGRASDNSFGKFLDALKNETRYRVSNSSYSFEEGGKVKVTLSIQSVGTIDLLWLGPRKVSGVTREINEICRVLNERIAELRGRGTVPSMQSLDTVSTFSDPASVLAASTSADTLKDIRTAVGKLDDAVISKSIDALFGEISSSGKLGSESEVEKLSSENFVKYQNIVNSLPVLGSPGDPLASDFIVGDRLHNLDDNTVLMNNGDEGQISGQKGAVTALGASDYVSFGSAFMKLIAEPVSESKQYDEVQVIFYPFNDHAGAVHHLPISCFPIEKARFIKAFEVSSKKSPEISLREVIGIMQDKFVGFMASRPYLMAGFYDKTKFDEGVLEAEDIRKTVARPASAPAKDAASKAEKDYNDAKARLAAANTAVSQAGTSATDAQKAAVADASNASNSALAASKQANEDLKKSQRKTVLVNKQLTFEKRLRSAGVLDGKFVLPKVEVAVEASKLLSTDGTPLVDERGNTKTLIKIHVYDSSMDPHSTLTDIIMAAQDKGLGVIADPVAKFNAASISGTGESRKSAATEAINAGLAAGVLEAVNIKTGDAIKNNTDGIFDGSVYYRINKSYDEVKRLVSAGMPTIIYGSSASAITSANLTTGGNAGLANVLLQRAFAPPGEAAPDNIDSGVPMQIIPSTLSISTIGCPLFYPMQRFFIDFGTGTSIDNVYYVISTENSIGSGGYKTDVKFAYSAGFATYTSLNQNLAMMAANLSQHINEAEQQNAAPITQLSKNQKKDLEKLKRKYSKKLLDATNKQLQLTQEAANRLKAEAARLEAEGKAKLAEIAEGIKQKANAIIPVEVQIAQAEALKQVQLAQEKAAAAEAEIARAAEITELVANLPVAAASLSPEDLLEEYQKIEALKKESDEYAAAAKK